MKGQEKKIINFTVFSIVKKMKAEKNLSRALSELSRPRPLQWKDERQRGATDIVYQRARCRDRQETARPRRGSRRTAKRPILCGLERARVTTVKLAPGVNKFFTVNGDRFTTSRGVDSSAYGQPNSGTSERHTFVRRYGHARCSEAAK